MRKRDLDDMDEMLVGWAEWLVCHGISEGFGGGVTFETPDRMSIGGARQVGTHSDPVLAEVLRDFFNDLVTPSRINRMILEYPTKHRSILKLRFAGIPTHALAEAQGYDATGVDVTMRRGNSGLLPFDQIPVHSDYTEQQARDTVRVVKKWLRRDLRKDRAVRAGLTGVDGNVRDLAA